MTIYRYYHSPPMCGVKNRRRIREYDPAAVFTGLSFHPIWNREEERFLVIGFNSLKYKLMFEMEFGTAVLKELYYLEINEEQRKVIVPAIAERKKKLEQF